jgi:hypothetical protein
MPERRRFPPPWTIEDRQGSFIVKDPNGLQIAVAHPRIRDRRQAAKRAAADIEGHSPAAEHGQPGRLKAGTCTVAVGLKLSVGPLAHGPPTPRLWRVSP